MFLKNKINYIKKFAIGLFTLFALSILIYYIWNNILTFDDPHACGTYDYNFDYEAFAYSDVQVNNTGLSNSQDSIPVKKGYYIYINLDIMTMYVYKDGQLYKTYPVSGGKKTTPSPIGTWKIISKDTWGEGFGGAWLGFNVPWGKYGIHGTVYPWLVGKSNQSKGCIRMLNKDVKELYKYIPYGTLVTVVQNNVPFRTMKSGDIGSDVKKVQEALKKLGYYNGYPDGKFGNYLKSAVQKFQKDNKLSVTGIINLQTYNKIIEKAQLIDLE